MTARGSLASFCRIVLPACLLLLAAPYALAQRPDDERNKARDATVARLGLTKEQQTQIEAFYTESDRQQRELMTKMRDLYHQLYTVYDNYDYDKNQASSIRREIGMLYKKRLTLTGENEDKLRRILNREQFDKLRALMKEQKEQRDHRMNDRRQPRPSQKPEAERGRQN